MYCSAPCCICIGRTGPTGPRGPQGPAGTSIIGPTGASGISITGPTGATGTSITGPTGPLPLFLYSQASLTSDTEGRVRYTFPAPITETGFLPIAVPCPGIEFEPVTNISLQFITNENRNPITFDAGLRNEHQGCILIPETGTYHVSVSLSSRFLYNDPCLITNTSSIIYALSVHSIDPATCTLTPITLDEIFDTYRFTLQYPNPNALNSFYSEVSGSSMTSIMCLQAGQCITPTISLFFPELCPQTTFDLNVLDLHLSIVRIPGTCQLCISPIQFPIYIPSEELPEDVTFTVAGGSGSYTFSVTFPSALDANVIDGIYDIQQVGNTLVFTAEAIPEPDQINNVYQFTVIVTDNVTGCVVVKDYSFIIGDVPAGTIRVGG